MVASLAADDPTTPTTDHVMNDTDLQYVDMSGVTLPPSTVFTVVLSQHRKQSCW